jgi:DNA repair exonuclease SbcCD ATPase subunit
MRKSEEIQVKILNLLVENFKKVRVVEINPSGRLIEITGRNGQGKTSVLDALWFALKGTKALPTRKSSIVRRGSERAKVRIGTEDFTITRTMARDGVAPTLSIEMQPGKRRDKTPQDFLDDLFGALTFDPQEFATMSPAAQVEELKKTVSVNVDFLAIAEANEADYNARTTINQHIRGIEVRLRTMTVLEGLPKEKVDEAAILQKLNDAGEANKRAQETFRAKQQLNELAGMAKLRRDECERLIEAAERRIVEYESSMATAKQDKETKELRLKDLDLAASKALQAYNAAPDGHLVEVGQLAIDLQDAQRTNRAIDARNVWNDLNTELQKHRSDSEQLTRAIEQREEEKRTSLASVEMPVKGLTFDENGVQYRGTPLENLGEGEQLRIAAEIGMAANPKLRVLCIRRGEALDEEGLKILANLAEERDFQLWITRVDSSGKVGVVLEDGMVMSHD